MNLTKIKAVKNHTLYVDTESLDFILEKKYDIELAPILSKLMEIQNNIFIPQIYNLEHRENHIFSYEQYLIGDTLDAQLSEGKFLTSDQFFSYLHSLCITIKSLHTSGIIHKDIKPENIVINNSIAYLIDYNISRVYDKKKSKDTKLIGTEGYASPEQYGFTQTTTKTDIYSLGKTIEQILQFTILEPRQFKQVTKLIETMTMLDPDLRPNISETNQRLAKIELMAKTETHTTNNTDINQKSKFEYSKNIIRPNIRQIFKGIIITTHGRRWDVVASAFYLFYSHAFNYEVSEHVFDHYPLFLILISYYLTTACFNFYTLNFSYPKLHNYKNRPRIIIAIQWYFVCFSDLFVFSFITYAIFEFLYKLT